MRLINPLVVNNFIDANIMNAVADGEDEAVNAIVDMNRADEIILLLPWSVRSELNDANTPAHVRRAATEFLFSKRVSLTEPERMNCRKAGRESSGASRS
jgi:hypothetical protein